jgi:SAM-dependent methyltransferase
VDKWICVEPDEALSGQIPDRIRDCQQADRVEVHTGYLLDLADRLANAVDAAVYIDVIEHLEEDRVELETAREVLKPGGVLFVLVPAHQFLFSPFDEALGHFRRYNKARLRGALPEGMVLESIHYLDSVGLLASLANRCLLRQSMPGFKQVSFWNRWMVPASRFMDPCLFHQVGKSLVMIARKKG